MRRRHFHWLTVILLVTLLLLSASESTSSDYSEEPSGNILARTSRWFHTTFGTRREIQGILNEKLGSKWGALNAATVKFLKEIAINEIIVVRPTDMDGYTFYLKAVQLEAIFKPVVSTVRKLYDFFDWGKHEELFPLTTRKTLFISNNVEDLIAAFGKRCFVALSDMNFKLRRLNLRHIS